MESQHDLVVAPEKDRQICQLQFGRFARGYNEFLYRKLAALMSIFVTM